MTDLTTDKNCNPEKEIRIFQIPNRFKQVGFAIFIVSFISMFVIAFAFNNDEVLKTIGKNGILLGLFIVSLSKEKIEDEFIAQLRMKSYSFAFIVSVIYSLAMPLVNYIFDQLFRNSDGYKELGDFNILWILLFVQVFSFHRLLRYSK
jgi:hypothetical protein